jgi:hypothetical protein
MHAICSSTNCSYEVELQDRVNGVSIPTPERCPECGSAVITFCRACGFPLLGPIAQERFTCEVCGGDVRETKTPKMASH